MDFSLTAAQSYWTDLAASLVPGFRERARTYDEAADFPEENIRQLRELGFFGLGVPVEYGGCDVGENATGFVQNLVVEKISEGCSSTGWSMMIHWINCQVVAQLAGEPLKRRVLTDVAKNGALIGSLGSEVDPQDIRSGTEDPGKLKISAGFQPVPGGFLANVKKHFCTLAPAANYILLWMLAPGTTRNEDGLTISVIPTEGADIVFDRKGWDECIGLRASVSWSAELRDVFIPWDWVMGEPGDFVQENPYTFDLAHVAHLLGTAQGILNFVVGFVKERDYLSKDDVYMYWLAEMHGSIQSSRASFWYTNWLWEQARFDECLLASYNALHSARQTALMVADKAFDICGTRALIKKLPIERSWRDIRAAALHTRDTQLARIQAQAILNGGRIFSKRKYGDKLARRKTWADLGLRSESVDA